MKKKVLILSALMAVVFGAVSLQSCSSDENYTTTEEYGFYTEEENELVRAMAKKYGLNVELNEGYYGKKRSLAEIEEEMKGLSSLLGKHELELAKKEDGKMVYAIAKDDSHIARTTTRTVEGPGSWSDSKQDGNFSISVEIKWDGNGIDQQTVTGKASISYKYPSSYDYSGGSDLQCSFAGDNGINFNGWVSYVQCESVDFMKQKVHYARYRFTIDAGQVSTNTPASGTFIVNGGKSEDFETNL